MAKTITTAGEGILNKTIARCEELEDKLIAKNKEMVNLRKIVDSVMAVAVPMADWIRGVQIEARLPTPAISSDFVETVRDADRKLRGV